MTTWRMNSVVRAKYAHINGGIIDVMGNSEPPLPERARPGALKGEHDVETSLGT